MYEEKLTQQLMDVLKHSGNYQWTRVQFYEDIRCNGLDSRCSMLTAVSHRAETGTRFPGYQVDQSGVDRLGFQETDVQSCMLLFHYPTTLRNSFADVQL